LVCGSLGTGPFPESVVGSRGGGREANRSPFSFLNSIQHVYGAQHPPFDPLLHGTLLKATPKVPTTPVKARRTSTFQEFESNTSDAWDASEDDDELLAMAAESLNTEVVMETANRVLRNHSQRQERRRPPEPPAVPSGDLRLVKSVSESHTSCPAGGMGAPSRRGAFLREKGPESSPGGRLGGFRSGCGRSSLRARGGLFFALPAERFSPPSAGAGYVAFVAGRGRRG
uniref:TBC1 domain family member 22A-like n=1 Tax=Panthera onca TaxID=9690 RepID=UPI002953EA3D